MKPFAFLALAAFAAVSLPETVAAQETESPVLSGMDPAPMAFRIDPDKRFVLRYDVRAGIQGRPAYFGSDEYVAAPDFALHFDYARLKGLGEIGSTEGGRPRAIGLRGSVRYIGERDSDDYDDLDGLDDVDMSLELGLGVVYRQKHFEAFGDVRYGVTGHNGVVGELGADAIFFPSDRWEFRVGPRFTFGDSNFAGTYFGVDHDEVRDSGMSYFDADGGLLGAGIEATAKYRLNDLWGIEAGLRADNLLNDAADSPITKRGSESQVRLRLGITRELMLQF